MKILLPPSETKRSGGDGAPLDVASLALPGLHHQRQAVIDALVDLSADEEVARRVLKLSPKQAGDVVHNRMLRSASTMPAVDRYTGVLYDALDAASLSPASRRWLASHAWIHSAPFGPIGALDPIPSYRLAAGTSLPGLPALRRHWAEATTAAIASDGAPFILDLRSEAYVALGPVPAMVSSAYVRVVTEHGRALNHFNKKSKGQLLRALAEDRPRVRSMKARRGWAEGRGITLRDAADPGMVELVVTE
ncbi:peroxide stress protein YaaA [Microbacterium sp. ISL-103]|uniref:YaaA family protein n=1 Tax=Microbacterium sp. ISL-103 TaxID=2819156 RepID=UPI001BE4F5DB|nr:peroxide stress protein YaaA [Microbacterium sp. ISL-103]MBT2473893.1 peroxide stress protein YaaA [Microbacterium sp. ISL-103]